MPRSARRVFGGTPHHVTQRGNGRQRVFFRPDDYRAWLAFAATAFSREQVEIWAYCLMPNHVHLIATPGDPAGLARAMAATATRYARRINDREGWSGHLWQGRFASFAMDEAHLLSCIRYVGLNPVRAGLVERAVDWPWSSVRGHLGLANDPLLTPGPAKDRLGDQMVDYFVEDAPESMRRRFRTASTTGAPLGARDWRLSQGRGQTPAVSVPIDVRD